jgi:uncharacterized membrane protein
VFVITGQIGPNYPLPFNLMLLRPTLIIIATDFRRKSQSQQPIRVTDSTVTVLLAELIGLQVVHLVVQKLRRQVEKRQVFFITNLVNIQIKLVVIVRHH